MQTRRIYHGCCKARSQLYRISGLQHIKCEIKSLAKTKEVTSCFCDVSTYQNQISHPNKVSQIRIHL